MVFDDLNVFLKYEYDQRKTYTCVIVFFFDILNKTGEMGK